MFKYVKFQELKNEFTTIAFAVVGDCNAVAHMFSEPIVSIEGEESDIDALVAAQDPRIECVYISHAEFKEIATSSKQLKRIRDVIAQEIAKRYSVADEVALLKRDAADPKRVAYEAYVAECKAIGDALKAEIGY